MTTENGMRRFFSQHIFAAYGNGGKVQYTYDAFKRVTGVKFDAATTNRFTYAYDAKGQVAFRYRGYVYDPETGLYYLRSRYYNPTWGRFINADSLVKGNLYCYCGNTPIVLIDPTGYDENGIQDRESNGFGFGINWNSISSWFSNNSSAGVPEAYIADDIYYGGYLYISYEPIREAWIFSSFNTYNDAIIDAVFKRFENYQKPKPYTHSRPSYAKGQVEAVWNNAINSEGKVIDPTGKEITWNRSLPRGTQWHMGHIPTAKYSVHHQYYMDGSWTLEQF